MSILNRKAKFNYHLLKEYTAGISLLGTEVKSLRNGKANITDAYVVIVDNEVYIRNMFIDKYEMEFHANHEEKRDRKLLLNRKEIKKLQSELLGTGKTIIPVQVFLSKNKFKVTIFLATGKKNYDKKQSLKEQDIKRQSDKELKKI